MPDDFALNQNYPNPFNPSTTRAFDIPETSVVKLAIFDILGQQVALLVDKELAAGTFEVKWDASSLPSGVYIARLRAGSFETAIQMTLQK